MNGFTNILYATDFSEASELACERAVELARRCSAKLTILHVYDGGTTDAEEQTLSRVALDVDDVEIHRVLYVGLPAETIVEYSELHDSDLIVMGTHGRSGFSHLLLGSVAEKVIRRAPCPVMVVRQQAARDTESHKPAERDSRRHVIVV